MPPEEHEELTTPSEGAIIPVDVEQLSMAADNSNEPAVDPTVVQDDDDEVTVRWKTSLFAVGKVKLKWSDELSERNGQVQSWLAWLSALFCHRAVRVGNMSVLYQRTPKDGPPQIVIVAGPFWFVPFCLTIPLTGGIHSYLYLRYIRCYGNFWLDLGWGLLLALLIGFLLLASWTDPGILLRQLRPPSDGQDWIWSDQALTYRPPHAKYDPICAVVVERFDHVCPWVGTAIGARNMKWFRGFIAMIVVCLFYDLILLYMADCSPNTATPSVGGLGR